MEEKLMYKQRQLVGVLLCMLCVSYFASIFFDEVRVITSSVGAILAVIMVKKSIGMIHSRWWYVSANTCLLVAWVLIEVESMGLIPLSAPMAMLVIGVVLFLIGIARGIRRFDKEERELWRKWLLSFSAMLDIMDKIDHCDSNRTEKV